VSAGGSARGTLIAFCAALLLGAGAVEKTVTVSEGTNVNAALSPDRKTIIVDLQEALWSLPAGGGMAKRLTDPFLEAARPDWSPKGDLIAFQSFKGGTFHIWVMKPDGSGVRQLTDGHGDDRDPRFSPDGKKVAFSSDRAFKGNYDIWVADAAGGQPMQWTTGDADEFEPAWSADGSEIAFVSGTGANGTSIQASKGPGAQSRSIVEVRRASECSVVVAGRHEAGLHAVRGAQDAVNGVERGWWRGRYRGHRGGCFSVCRTMDVERSVALYRRRKDLRQRHWRRYEGGSVSGSVFDQAPGL